MEYIFSNKVKDMEGSAIRAVLKLTSGKNLITFAAGVPAPETLPVDFIKATVDKALTETPTLALQYGVTDGYNVLVERLQKKAEGMGVDLETNSVVVTTGGQQVIDLAARALLNEGDLVACETPTFIGGLNAFKSYNTRQVGIPMTDDGMDLNALEDVLKKEKVKMVYTIPTFHNPMGVTMPLENRKELLKLASKYDFMILEDNPYGELRFAGEYVPTIKSLDTEGRVIYAGSFSKILSPGLRVGFTFAPHAVADKMVVAKQITDVHTPMINQIVAAEFLNYEGYDKHIENCCSVYRKKVNLMTDCIDKCFPEYVTRTSPTGGIFLWCKINKDADTLELMQKALEKGVAFIPGYTFMIDTSAVQNTFRLNYSIPSENDIINGIEIIADIIKENVK